MQKIILLNFYILFFLTFYQNISHAYIGPGLGVGVIMATIGIIVAIFAGIIGAAWFPIKKLINKTNKKKIKNRKKKKIKKKF